eukprot:447080-Amphidinium_carterae.1
MTGGNSRACEGFLATVLTRSWRASSTIGTKGASHTDVGTNKHIDLLHNPADCSANYDLQVMSPLKKAKA